MKKTRLSLRIHEAIRRADGKYKGIGNLSREVNREVWQVRDILARMQGEGLVKVIPSSPAYGRGNHCTIVSTDHE